MIIHTILNVYKWKGTNHHTIKFNTNCNFLELMNDERLLLEYSNITYCVYLYHGFAREPKHIVLHFFISA